jgi:hypothetical protein
MPPRKRGKAAKSSQKTKRNLPASAELPGPTFHFQAWYVNNEPVSECIRHNERLAKLITRSLSGDLARLLIVNASTPKPTQSLVVPVSVRYPCIYRAVRGEISNITLDSSSKATEHLRKRRPNDQSYHFLPRPQLSSDSEEVLQGTQQVFGLL